MIAKINARWPIVAVDMDGVLANFNDAFARLLNDLHATEISLPPDGPAVWSWPTIYGWTSSQHHKAWEHIQENGEWWLDLEPLPQADDLIDALLQLRHRDVPIYFVTSRSPLALAQEATSAWLEAHHFALPSVIVVPPGVGKPQIFAAIGATIIIDDKPDNCSVHCTNLLVDAPYNRDKDAWHAPWSHIIRCQPHEVAQILLQQAREQLERAL